MTTMLARRSRLFLLLFIILAGVGLWEVMKVRPKHGREQAVECPDCGKDRFYLLYAGPDEAAAQTARNLIIVLHGYRSSAAGTIAATGGRFEDLAEDDDVVVVHAESHQDSNNWFIGDKGSANNTDDQGNIIDDFAYIDKLWEDVSARYGSLQRVHLVGMSRGAMASYALTCAGRLPVVSLTVFTMPMPEQAVTDCQRVSGIDFTLINGNRDNVVPHGGGEIELPWIAKRPWRKKERDLEFGQVESTEDTLHRWHGFNGCDSNIFDSQTENEVRDGTAVVTRRWTNCNTGTVTHLNIVGGGHRWNNERRNPLALAIFGLTTREVIRAMPSIRD
jgi:poly(3-hydroxybutyrate) depolymerase